MRDTSDDAMRVRTDVYRRMTGEQRAAIGLEMAEEARLILLAGIRQRHAEYTDEDCKFAMFRLLVGDALFARAWPHERLRAP